MNRFFVFVLGCLMLCCPMMASAEWITVCDGEGCARYWRGPVQRIQDNRAARIVTRQSYGSYGGYVTSGGSSGSFRSTVVSRRGIFGRRVFRSYASYGGYSSPSYSVPMEVTEPTPADPPTESSGATVPTSAKPVKVTQCQNPACRCGDNCQCDPCDCTAAVPAKLLAEAQACRITLPPKMVATLEERTKVQVPAFDAGLVATL